MLSEVAGMGREVHSFVTLERGTFHITTHTLSLHPTKDPMGEASKGINERRFTILWFF